MTGKINSEKQWNIFIFYLIVFQLFSANFIHAQWTKTNGPCGGNVYSLAICASNVLAGTENGIFLSTNNGTYWTNVNDCGEIRSIAVDGNKVFAGTSGNGVYISYNGGLNWAPAGLTGYNVCSFLIEGINVFAGTNDGLFLSTDNGVNWAKLGLGGYGVSGLVRSGSNIIAGTNKGGFLSTNNGRDWRYTNIGNITNPANVYSLLSDGSYVYAGVYAGGLSRSTNNGETWESCRSYILVINDMCMIGTDLYLATLDLGILCSSDHGVTLSKINVPYVRQYISITAKDSMIFAGTTYGIFFSHDAGKTWVSVNDGLANAITNSLAVIGSRIFAGTFGSGVNISTDNGASWTNVSDGLSDKSNSWIFCLCSSDTTLYAGTGSGVCISTNYGKTWEVFDHINSQEYQVNCIATYGKSIFAGVLDGILISRDNGSTWSFIQNNLLLGPILSIAVSGANIFVGTLNHGVILSTDNGFSWTAINNGLDISNIWSIVINNQRIFATTCNGIFLSTNLGTSWKRIAISRSYVRTLLATTGAEILAGTDTGILISRDYGQNWGVTNLTNGCPAIVMSGSTVFAAAGEVWKCPIDNITAVDKNISYILNYILSQNYPNPFNPTTNISYSIPQLVNVTLKVYDLLGREVVELVNGEKNPGKYEVIFDGSNLSSGIYFYRLTAGSFSQTKKLLLIK